MKGVINSVALCLLTVRFSFLTVHGENETKSKPHVVESFLKYTFKPLFTNKSTLFLLVQVKLHQRIYKIGIIDTSS